MRTTPRGQFKQHTACCAAHAQGDVIFAYDIIELMEQDMLGKDERFTLLPACYNTAN